MVALRNECTRSRFSDPSQTRKAEMSHTNGKKRRHFTRIANIRLAPRRHPSSPFWVPTKCFKTIPRYPWDTQASLGTEGTCRKLRVCERSAIMRVNARRQFFCRLPRTPQTRIAKSAWSQDKMQSQFQVFRLT